jgi:hypothetical protein
MLIIRVAAAIQFVLYFPFHHTMSSHYFPDHLILSLLWIKGRGGRNGEGLANSC